MAIDDERYPIRETSLAAFDSIRNYRGTFQQKALACLKIKPMTCEEVETVLQAINPEDGKHQSVSATFTNLSDTGQVVDTLQRRRTRSQREAIVWRLPFEGEVVDLSNKRPKRAAIVSERDSLREDMALITSTAMADGGYFERLARIHAIAAKWAA